MAAASYNFTVEQGTDFSVVFRLWNDAAKTQPRNLSGVTARSQWRKLDGTLALDVSNSFTLSGQDLTLVVTHDQTTPLKRGAYLYDIELVTGTTVERLVKGRVTITGEQTR